MADEDKEKAEKLAAAKKRFEELKKQQAKKGKKGGKKKDKEQADASNAEAAEDGGAEQDGETGAVAADEKEAEVSEETKAEAHRSESNAHSEVQELYKKQAAKIEELEKENKSLKDQHDEHTKKLAKTEEELESLREGSGDASELKSRAKAAERLSTELASVQRQLSQAQQAAGKGPTRRQSGTSPDASEQLASKDSIIQSLELDISNLRNQITTLENTVAERDISIHEANERTTAAEAATESAKQELESLKLSIAIPSDETAAANEDPEALTKRITVLESDLRSANSDLEAAAKRATSLEQKIEALTKLHKDSLNTSQSKDRELNDLRSQLKRQSRPSHVRDASEFELNEDETEVGALQARIRALEAENFDLRRGVWRDRRAELQPGMEDNYEDVDLNTPHSAGGRKASLPRQTSTFQDVITSGINAFTGREPAKPPHRDRAMSMGLLSEDGFDEEAFRLAQEQEQKNRIERIKEVKRGLEQWRGWRIDLADLRQKGAGPDREVGPVFEV
ncbi:hypothetical protein AC578_5411 [Pseudocercospora eumusae]|uniref:M protein repeat protein n=1 Tax=Pseudocercospora eumusae TaxID=321146 RepID=A0A139HK17_9PEZI|nr:hypothetical protein AC578_5411 [Pseudocercospora eumusae]